ncbi:MAG TPA: DinB family protein, partial [Vicinamibacterales bacterium]|nr:DinB family protein [Vicinamibacterales bacterium]
EWIWYERWIGHSPTALPDVSMFPDVPTLRAAWKTQERSLRLLVHALAGSDELDRAFKYRLLDGSEMESLFSQMLQHVVNHATFHRGQVTTMLRQLGAPAPKPQDLIRFYRERATRVH